VIRRTAAAQGLVAAALGCVVGLLAGCAAAPPAPVRRLTGSEQVVAALERHERETRTFTATFDLASRGADGVTESSRGAVTVSRPDRLRLQIFSLGFVTVYDFTVDGARYRVRRPLEGVDEIGRFGESGSTAGTLGEALRPLFLREENLPEARVVDAGEYYRVVIPDLGGERREIDVAKESARVEHEALYADGRARLEIDYADYRSVEGAALPFTIRVRYPQKAISLAIEVRNYTRNEPVDAGLFRF
jgi:hypothetical protein